MASSDRVLKLGVFDSGIGGITVLEALKRRFPEHDFAYFGDTLNVPYGTKSETVIRLLSESAGMRMADYGLDAVVVACNTASSLALPEFEKTLSPIPVFGMVEAGVAAILDAFRLGFVEPSTPVIVFGTRATVRSGVYGRLLRAALPEATVFEQACPLLVPIIEEGWKDHEILRTALREYAAAYQQLTPGVALLGCTHYPWIRGAFESALPGWKIIDSAEAVCERLAEAFPELLSTQNSGVTHWYFSDPETVAPFIFGNSPPVLDTF
ncbi:MAG: glutamate racemase [Cryobacterium sp.]|nr:glutamate racemase [Oligoflexia bacterium]